jgi:multiple sugar transport system permease protein
MTELTLRSRPVPPRRRARLRRRVADNVAAYAIMAAGILCFGLFAWYPLVKGLELSFQQNNFVDPPRWVGLENFRRVVEDPLFATAWRNTFEFTGLALVLGYAVPFLCAVVFNELRHLQGFLRAAVYLPVMLPPAVSILLWKYFYDPGNGLFNSALRSLHLPASQWVQSPDTAMISLVLVSTWMNMGGALILYLAGLKAIPGELYEAAAIDGAGIFRRFRDITLPSMRFLLLVLLLLQVIATMQIFTEPYLLTGTTNPATVTVMVLIYRYAFSVNQDLGLAAAMSMILFVVLAVLSAAYLWLTRARST